MASEDVQTNLRLPLELKEQLLAAARENNRSLSAEAAYRLEESFRHKSTHVVVFEEMLTRGVSELQNRIEMIDVRRDMVKTRIDNAQIRSRLAGRELQIAKLRPSHPENDTSLQATHEEIAYIERSLRLLAQELSDLEVARQKALGEISELEAAIADGKRALEERVAAREPKP